MDDQCSQCASARCLLEFVGPAPVVGHPLAAETACDCFASNCCKVRIVNKEDGKLAAQIDVAKIIPATLRRESAMTDEDYGCVVDDRTLNRPSAAELYIRSLD